MHHLRFRQIHLDFHTSPAIPGIGQKFKKKEWQERLQAAAVNSITCFSKCHHGWSYHPTTVGKEHPHLSFNLLREQMDACKEVDINCPIYISAGVDNVITMDHPEWREMDVNGAYMGWNASVLKPGFHKLCFNTPYTDYLCEQIVEAVKMFPEADGVFLDIIFNSACCCKSCMAVMEKEGLNPEDPEDRKACSRIALKRYYDMTTAACKADNANMPVFHNSGHIQRGSTELLQQYFSHLELESLPTGGWGYDHYPLSAKYCKGIGLDVLGMTGKFHTTWGEFGGYKHPNALKYECAAMIAYGSKCSVGDQLHPEGNLDESTYAIIGEAYRDVAKKEAWCDQVETVKEIGLLSGQAVNGRPDKHAREHDGDTGACRVLLENHYVFDVLDETRDFTPYKLLILPDDLGVEPELATKLQAYLDQGGKLLLSGTSGLDSNGKALFDIGGTLEGTSPYRPDFVLPKEDLRADLVTSPLVMYLPSQRLKVTDGTSLGDVYDPYFNRSFKHFCSHQHTPYRQEPSGFSLGVIKGNVAYLAHPVFTNYRGFGAVAYRRIICGVIDQLLGKKTLQVNMPSTARVSLMKQPAEKRYILHLLYANTVNRGGPVHLDGGNLEGSRPNFEVIDELLPLRDVKVTIRPEKRVSCMTLEPEGEPLAFEKQGDAISFEIDAFTCHQMVVLHYA